MWDNRPDSPSVRLMHDNTMSSVGGLNEDGEDLTASQNGSLIQLAVICLLVVVVAAVVVADGQAT
jgi:hypothetical protein